VPETNQAVSTGNNMKTNSVYYQQYGKPVYVSFPKVLILWGISPICDRFTMLDGYNTPMYLGNR
jgi:hypothetical protein